MKADEFLKAVVDTPDADELYDHPSMDFEEVGDCMLNLYVDSLEEGPTIIISVSGDTELEIDLHTCRLEGLSRKAKLEKGKQYIVLFSRLKRSLKSLLDEPKFENLDEEFDMVAFSEKPELVGA